MVQNAAEGKKDVRSINVGQGCSNTALRIISNRSNKHLITGHKGNSEFCFPETLSVSSGNSEVEGKQNSLFLVRVCSCRR